MGAEGMQASLRNNKRDRKSIFDSKKDFSKSNFKDFVDDKKMTEYEFHEFQKKLKKDNTKRQKKYLIKSIITLAMLISVVIYILFFA